MSKAERAMPSPIRRSVTAGEGLGTRPLMSDPCGSAILVERPCRTQERSRTARHAGSSGGMTTTIDRKPSKSHWCKMS